MPLIKGVPSATSCSIVFRNSLDAIHICLNFVHVYLYVFLSHCLLSGMLLNLRGFICHSQGEMKLVISCQCDRNQNWIISVTQNCINIVIFSEICIEHYNAKPFLLWMTDAYVQLFGIWSLMHPNFNFQISALCMAFYARSEEARQSHSVHRLALVRILQTNITS